VVSVEAAGERRCRGGDEGWGRPEGVGERPLNTHTPSHLNPSTPLSIRINKHLHPHNYSLVRNKNPPNPPDPHHSLEALLARPTARPSPTEQLLQYKVDNMASSACMMGSRSRFATSGAATQPRPGTPSHSARSLAISSRFQLSGTWETSNSSVASLKEAQPAVARASAGKKRSGSALVVLVFCFLWLALTRALWRLFAVGGTPHARTLIFSLHYRVFCGDMNHACTLHRIKYVFAIRLCLSHQTHPHTRAHTPQLPPSARPCAWATRPRGARSPPWWWWCAT